MSSQPDRDVVIFLHGRALEPETAEEIAGAFLDVELLAPAGGVVLRRGRTWFENERVGVAKPESVAAAEQRLLAFCDTQPFSGRPAWLCGFSNGGALAAHMLMRHPERFLGAALLSAPFVLPPWPDGALAGKSVFYAHGDAQDTIVPEAFYATAETYLLGGSGSLPTIRRYSAGHRIGPATCADLATWFDRVRSRDPSADPKAI